MYRAGPYDPPADDRNYDNYRRGRDGEISAKEMSHEQRRERERPTRTLFVRNVPYESSQEEITDIFSAYGNIAKVYDLIQKRGMAFVTYFDLRHADRAKRALQGHLIQGRPINIHYSLPRDDDNISAENAGENPQAISSIFVLVRDPTSEITNQDVHELFSQWGEVKEVRDGRGKTVVTKFVDYWDTRDAMVACKAANEIPFKGGRLEARFALNTTRRGDAQPGDRERGGVARPDRTGAHDYSQPRHDEYRDDRRGNDWRGSYDPYYSAPTPPRDPYYPPAPTSYAPPPPPPPSSSSSYPQPSYGGSYPSGSTPYPPAAGATQYPPPPPPASSSAPLDDQSLLAQINQLQTLLQQQQRQQAPPSVPYVSQSSSPYPGSGHHPYPPTSSAPSYSAPSGQSSYTPSAGASSYQSANAPYAGAPPYTSHPSQTPSHAPPGPYPSSQGSYNSAPPRY